MGSMPIQTAYRWVWKQGFTEFFERPPCQRFKRDKAVEELSLPSRLLR